MFLLGLHRAHLQSNDMFIVEEIDRRFRAGPFNFVKIETPW